MGRVKLGDLALVTAGQAAPKTFDDDGIPFIRAGHLEDLISNSLFFDEIPRINQNNAKKHGLKLIPDNTILFAKSGMSAKMNRIYVTKNNSYFVSHLAAILPSSKYNTQYLSYYFSWYNPSKFINDNAYPSIRLEEIQNHEITLPSLAEQKAIAAKLDKADEIKRLNQQLIEKYDALTQSLFIDMFGDPVKNEKGWEVKKLKELSSTINSGNTPKGGSEVYVESGITFFRSQNVWKNRLVYEDIAFIDDLTHKSMRKSSLKYKDILMTKTGRINTENSSLGRAALFLGDDGSANVNGHVYLIRLKEKNVHEYVLFILTSKPYRDHIRSVCVGGIDKRQLNKEHIEDFPIIYPPIALQNQFAERVQAIEAQKQLAQKALTKSEVLFNSLLQQSFG